MEINLKISCKLPDNGGHSEVELLCDAIALLKNSIREQSIVVRSEIKNSRPDVNQEGLKEGISLINDWETLEQLSLRLIVEMFPIN